MYEMVENGINQYVIGFDGEFLKSLARNIQLLLMCFLWVDILI